MKYLIHVPTTQFGFIETEVEGDSYEAMIEHNKLLNLATGQTEGLDVKEWQNTLDSYLNDGEMDSDCYERMSLKQKGLIQEIKRSMKRINK